MPSIPAVFAFAKSFSKKEIKDFLEKYMSRKLRNTKKQALEENESYSPKKRRKLDLDLEDVDETSASISSNSDSYSLRSGHCSSGSGQWSSGSGHWSSGSRHWLSESGNSSPENVGCLNCTQFQDSGWEQNRVSQNDSQLQGPRKLSKRLERILRNKPTLSKKRKFLALNQDGVDNTHNVFDRQNRDKRICLAEECQDSVKSSNSPRETDTGNGCLTCTCAFPDGDFYICNHGNSSVVSGRSECCSDKDTITDVCMEKKPTEKELEPSLGNDGLGFPDLSQYVAMDCECVGVGVTKSGALGRCSIVDFRGDVLYDSYSKPDLPITDYRTRWSGIRPRDMKHALPQEVVLQSVKTILEGKIVVGHALFNDFQVLKIRHPRQLIRDTHSYKPLRQRVPASPSLKNLTKNLLGLEIQDGEHCSVEDARAALKLYLLARDEWESSLLQKALKKKEKFDKTEQGQNLNSAHISDNDSLSPKSFLDDEFWPEEN